MRQPQEWDLVFSCPKCKKASRVSVSAMQSLLRCPHCRKMSAIDSRGMSTTSVRAAMSGVKTKPADPVHPRKHLATRSPLAWIAICLILPILALSLSPLLLRIGPADSDLESQQLSESARSFQTALLQADMPSALPFVVNDQGPKLEQWWTPQRASLAASFGRGFQGRVTEVEIISMQRESAVVRVRFKIRDREQQTFQNWKRVDARWQIAIDTTAADEEPQLDKNEP